MYSVYSSTLPTVSAWTTDRSSSTIDRLAQRLQQRTWEAQQDTAGRSQDEWVRWLRQMKWDWFVTLTCAPRAATQDQVRGCVGEWLRVLRTQQDKAYAACVVECGEHLGGWHAHVLLGGVGTHPEWPDVLRTSWGMFGAAHVSRYSPTLDAMKSLRRGASAYMVKDMPTTTVEIVGRLRKFRPRIRRARGTVWA